MSDAKPSMVWVDIETTGLSLDIDAILEVGIIVTDRYGNEYDSISWIVNDPAHRAFIEDGFLGAKTPFDEFVIKMHSKSGLLKEWLAAPNKTNDQVAREAVSWLVDVFSTRQEWVPDSPLPMCGSSVHFDRYMIQANMPLLCDWFSYRIMDVSTLREAAKVLNPRIAEHEPNAVGSHRVLDDLRDSIGLFRYYTDEFLMPDGG